MRAAKLMICLAAVAILAAGCEKDNGTGKNGSGKSNVKIDTTGLTVNGKFPIIAWTGINSDETATKFTPMKQCGINVYLGWYDTLNEVTTALDNAQKAGVKLIIKSNELTSSTESTVKKMMNHPALFGYHIKDEPEVSDFSTLSSIVNSIEAVDQSHFCYINLYPNWAWGNVDDYMSKLTSFLSTVHMKFLSFDHYPVREINGVSSLRPEWYKNLEDIRKVSRARGIPFWAFGLALSHKLDNVLYPVPTVGELRLQMFSNLAYGAQGFQYFTYWGIYQSVPTQVYSRVQTVNKSLQKLAKIFLGADVTDVWHTGESIPYGTKQLKTMPDGISSLKTGETGAVVSRVVKDNEVYIAIVNKDYQNKMTLDIAFTSAATAYDNEGYKSEAESGSYTMDPGDIIIFQIQ